ncbi:MAG: DUF3644 domain-containing protein [Acidimicrobiales bacterium]
MSEATGLQESPGEDDVALAERLWVEWDRGKGTSKSQIEIREWGDATSHGRRFDRFIRRTLGEETNRPSKQTDRIAELEQQVRCLGADPVGAVRWVWEPALQHARSACLAGLRIWNDPTCNFRTAGFSLHFVTAWNSLAIALLQKSDGEWRRLDDEGNPEMKSGVEQSRDTTDMVDEVFAGANHRGLRQNISDWTDLRNSVAHRHLPALDVAVIPLAQAGLLNFENTLTGEFGEEWGLVSQLSVPLQLSGFRDPGVVKSLRQLQASLPVDVQAILTRAGDASPELLADPTYQLRVALVPTVPASGRSPDAVAYFVRPGEVPPELAESLERFVVLPKAIRAPRPNLSGKQVVAAVAERIPWRFRLHQLAPVARALRVRPASDVVDQAETDPLYCEWVPAAKLYLYNQAWVDRLVEELADPKRHQELVGKAPVPKDGGSMPLP